MNYDAWLQSDYDFDNFPGKINVEPEEKPDYMQEREMEKLREKYHIGEENE